MTNIGNIWGHIPKSLEKDFHRPEGFLEEEQYERLADYVTRPEHLIVQMHTLLSRSMAITSGQRQALEYLLMFVDSTSQGKNRLAKKPDALCYFMSIFHNGFDGMPLELIACLHEKAKEDGCHLLTRLVERIKVRNISITLSDAYSEKIGFRSRKELLDKPLMKAIAHFVPTFGKYFDTATDIELLSDGAEELKNVEDDNEDGGDHVKVNAARSDTSLLKQMAEMQNQMALMQNQMQQARTDPRSPMNGWTWHPQGNGLFNPPGYMNGQQRLPPLRNTMMGRGAPRGRGSPQGN